MDRFFRAAKPILLCLALSIIIAGSSFANVSAEDDSTIATPDVASLPIAEAAPEPVYTYNESTGLWDSNFWHYDPLIGSYQPVPVVVEVVVPDPEFVFEENINNNVDVNNSIQSDATTGDASVSTNTEAGNAISGDADSTATILNNINSVTNINGQEGGVATFSADILGDVSGDIVLQPMISQTLAGPPINSDNATTNLTNVSSITNDINLNATSGDATVEKNTKAGDAVTGSAETVANIINIVNSMIVAGQSFIGAINIYGNYIGDILISPDFVPQLLATNSGGGSSPQSVVVSSSDTTDIVNNLSLNAASGQALVSGNSHAGNAITGDALTNLVIFNLTGHDIIADNCLLLFINVLGEWYGVIVDAPAGSTAAIIGNNVESDTLLIPDINASIDNKVEITNNITLNSQSGDASVLGNSVAGDAISGDATASVNLANIVGSRLSLSGWFGILFINVFGRWFGDFGIKVVPPVVDDPNVVVVEPVIDFIPKENVSVAPQSLGAFLSADLGAAEEAVVDQDIVKPELQGAVLGALDEKTASSINYILLLVVIIAAATSLWLSWIEMRKFFAMRKSKIQ